MLFSFVPAPGTISTAARVEAPPAPLFPPLRANRAFYLVLVMRAFVTMGIYSVYGFFLYFIRGRERPAGR